MTSLLPVLLPILLTDVINPVLLAAMIYAMGGKKPVYYGLMVLLGWMTIYFGSGIIIAIGLESITNFLQNPRTIDFYIETVVAALLIYFGIRFLIPSKKPAKENDFGDSSSLTAVGAFGMGAAINLIGLPFAIPYFAALDQILKANLGWFESLGILLLYNVLYIAPFITLIIIKLALGERGDLFLEKVNNLMDKIGKILLPGIMILLGIALLIDAIKFFVTGQPWF